MPERNRITPLGDIEAFSAQQMNRVLHAERIVRGTHRRRLHDLPVAGLPDGVFVLLAGAPSLVLGGSLVE